ncbi:hypothetical protein F4556_003408 [Kitasatospora gansuensis]|uniref:Uncharacterized protein n=1 Tax=Kitasatospora gansuensis TaxID=258050 RepID=A0A7W7SDF6_9ACTN|nr:hypothetical protein [Kitasatospora gansuensis]
MSDYNTNGGYGSPKIPNPPPPPSGPSEGKGQ